MSDGVAIVGGGPAGAWAAWRLASAGARVFVFDASHPREKPCGGGVTGRALELVRPALESIALPRVDVESLTFEDDSGSDVAVNLAGGSLAVFSRTDFDRALLEAARTRGAELVGERVTDVQRQPGGVEIRTAAGVHRAAHVIGADGANSLVRRRLGRAFTRREISIGTGFFARGATSTRIIVRYVADPPGYIWSFPRADHLAIGVCAQADEASVDLLKARARHWIATARIARDASLTPYSWPIPSLRAADFSRDRIAGDRWLLAGDAAGLVDPITREGIFFALKSADLAADALLHARSAASYATAVAQSIYPELTRAARLKAGFFRPQFIALLLHALRTSAAVRAVMADLVAGRQPYHGLSRRLLKTYEFGLAWRLFTMPWARLSRADATRPDA